MYNADDQEWLRERAYLEAEKISTMQNIVEFQNLDEYFDYVLSNDLGFHVDGNDYDMGL